MDIRHLRYFVAIVEEGSLSKAARLLHIVQPALSQRLADLEGESGIQLLVRGKHGVAPTPAGDELYRRACLILKQFEATRAALQEFSGSIAGPVQLGVLRTAAPILIPRLFKVLRERYSEIVPHIRVGYSAELAGLLRTGKLDVAMHVLDVREKREGATVYSEGLCVVGPRHLIGNSSEKRLRDLAEVPLLLSRRQPSYAAIAGLAATRGVTLSIIGDVDDNGALLDICRSGLAATIQPESVGRAQASDGALIFAPLDEPGLRRDIVVVTNPDVPPTAAVIAVQDLLSSVLRELYPEVGVGIA